MRQIQARRFRVVACAAWLLVSALGPSVPALRAQGPDAELSWTFEALRDVERPSNGCPPSVGLHGLAFVGEIGAAGWSVSGCGLPGGGLVAATRDGNEPWSIVEQNPVPAMHGRPALALSPQGHPVYVFAALGPNDTYYIYEHDLTGDTPMRRMPIAASQSSLSHPNISAMFTPGAMAPTFVWSAHTGMGGPLVLGSPLGDVTLATVATYSVDNAGPHVAIHGNHTAGPGVYYSPGVAGDLRHVIPTTQSGGVSIATDSSGALHLASSGARGINGIDDTRLVALSSIDGHTWERIDIDPSSTRHPSLAIDSFGNPAIAYIRNDTELRLARRVNGEWQHTLVAGLPMGAGDTMPHLAFDAADRAHVLFYDTTTRTIMLARGEAAAAARTLRVSKVGAGSGDVVSAPAGIACGAACSASYGPGQHVLLEARAHAGSAFDGWGGACTGTGPCLVTMHGASSVVASFTTTRPPIEVSPPGTGGCSLAAAIQAANSDSPVGACAAGSGADVIHLPAGVYSLDAVDNSSQGLLTGLPIIASDITIVGDGPQATIIERASGAPVFRLLRVYFIAGSRLTLDGVTLRGGNGEGNGGGAIYTDNPTVIRNSVFTDNHAGTSVGGAIRASAALTVANSQFTNNVAPVAEGGAIYASGSQTAPLTITTSKFEGNSAMWGGAVEFSTSAPHASAGLIANTIFNGNTALRGGGAINGSGLTLMRATVTGNRVTAPGSGGGGLLISRTTIVDSTITDNIVFGPVGGGGVLNPGGTLEISGTTIARNVAEYGGGAAFSGVVTLTNVTFSDNRSTSYGGGLMQAGGRADLQNVTIADNEAGTFGGGLASVGAAFVTLQNTILARNRAVHGYIECYATDFALTSAGYNLIGDASCPYVPGPGDLLGTAPLPIDPLLGPLQDHGGATFTRLPELNSPVVDAGSPMVAGSDSTACDVTDQRGMARPQRAACDIGAVERANNAPVATAQSVSTPEDVGVAISVSAADLDGDLITLTIVDQPAHGTLTGSLPDLTYTPAADFFGVDRFTFAGIDVFATEGQAAVVEVTVTPVNDQPTALDDDVSVKQNGRAQVIDVLANDFFAPDTNEDLFVAAVNGTIHGVVSIAPGGTHVIYEPPHRFVGLETFTYTIGDHHSVSAPATVVVRVMPTVDLAVSLEVDPNPAMVGTVTTWRMTVKNEGGMDAFDITATMSFFGSLIYLSPDSCGRSGDVLTCGVPMLLAGESRVFNVIAAPSVVGPVTLSAHASYRGDPFTLDNSAFVIVPVTESADLSVHVSGVSSAQTGNEISYNVHVENLSGVNATGVFVLVAIPASVDFVSASSPCTYAGTTVTCYLGPLDVHSPVDLEIKVVPRQVGMLSLTATIDGSQADSQAGNDVHSTDAIAVTTGTVDLVVTVPQVPAPVMVSGAVVSYTVVITNQGANMAKGVTLVAALPAGTAFESATAPGGSCSSNAASRQAICDLSFLAVNASVEVVVRVRHVTASDTLTMTFTADAAQEDSFPLSNTLAVTTPVGADLRVSLVADPVVATVGLPFVYTIEVTNDGPGIAREVRLDVTVPPFGFSALTLTPLECQEVEDSASNYLCTAPAIGPGQTARLTLTKVRLRPSEMTTEGAPAKVQAYSPTLDGQLQNNVAELLTQATTSADLRVTVRPPAGNIYRGDRINYHVSVINDGLMAVGSATTTVVLPEGSLIVSATAAPDTSCTQVPNTTPPTVECRHSLIAFQGGAEITIQVVLADSSSPMTATAAIASPVIELNPADNQAAVTITPLQRPAGRALLIVTGAYERAVIDAFAQANNNVNVSDYFSIPDELRGLMETVDGVSDAVNNVLTDSFRAGRAAAASSLNGALQSSGCLHQYLDTLAQRAGGGQDFWTTASTINPESRLECLLQTASDQLAHSHEEIMVMSADRLNALRQLKDTLRAKNAQGLTVDVLIDAAGCGDVTVLGNQTCPTAGLAFPDGVITADDIRALNDGDPLRLGWVYSTGSWGSQLNQAWLDLGAESADGAFERNYNVVISALAFLDGVTRLGLSPGAAAKRAEYFDSVLASGIQPRSPEIRLTVPDPTWDDPLRTKEVSFVLPFVYDAVGVACAAAAGTPLDGVCSSGSLEARLRDAAAAAGLLVGGSLDRYASSFRVNSQSQAVPASVHLRWEWKQKIPAHPAPFAPAPFPDGLVISAAGVAATGLMSMVGISADTLPTIPSGWQLIDPPLMFEVQTTAILSPPITFTISYDPGLIDPYPLVLLHYTNGAYEEVHFVVDSINHTLTAMVESLSPFVIVRRPIAADTTPPAVWPSVSGTAALNDWYRGDVTVSWELADEQSAIRYAMGCGATSITLDTTGQLVTCAATSDGGTTSRSVIVKRDSTAPSLTTSGNLLANATSASGALINFAAPSAADATSGVASMPSCSPASGSTFAIGATTVNCTASDNAGNTASASFTVTVTPPAGNNGEPGRMHGQGHVTVDNHRVQFDFSVLENAKKGERGKVNLRISRGRNGRWDDGRFNSKTVTDVSFANAPTYAPGRNPKTGIDTVVFTGSGKWDKHDGHTYIVTASDRGEPGRNLDTFTVEVRAPNGQIVFTGGGAIAAGNVQSTRVKR